MKTQILAAATVVSAMALLSGCAGFAFFPKPTGVGSLYSATQLGEQVRDNKVGSKTGESCAMSILGLVTMGDASVNTAAKAAGITTIGAVDNDFTNIIGVYSKYCVRVNGD
jgi:hypothetical protein